MSKVSDSQKQAQARYDKKNREKRTYLTQRSTSRGFIRNKATEEDLNELQNLINERKKDLVGIKKDSENDTEKLIDKLI